MRTSIALLAIFALFAVPGAAFAQGPGGADEYTETLPGAGGNQQSGSGPLTPDEVEALEAQGPDGAAAAEAAQATGPDATAGVGGEDTAAGDGDGSSAAASDGESGGAGITELVGDVAGGSDDGMGPVLPIVLAVALIGAVGFLIARRSQAGRA